MVAVCDSRFSIQKFYVLPAKSIYVFCMDHRTNFDFFPYVTLTEWFFKRVRKIVKGDYSLRHVCPYGRLSAWNNWTPTRRIFMKFYFNMVHPVVLYQYIIIYVRQ